MMTVPLARDQAGESFELPDEAAFWRVRRMTTGRPKTVLGPDGEPLYIPIQASERTLEDNGCEPDKYRLEACDGEREPIDGVPIAVVELHGGAIEPVARGELVPAYIEPPRTSTEALTRALEASQRTQLERERNLAERERWQMHAMVESQRSMALICTSLIERLKPSSTVTANDPLTILKKQAEADEIFHRMVERRNGGAPQGGAEPDDEKPADPMQWLSKAQGIIGQFAPGVNLWLKSRAFEKMGLPPEQIAEKLKAEMGAPVQPDGEADDGFITVNYPRSIRQVLGELTDEEAPVLDDIFCGLKDGERIALFEEADKIEDLAERVEWTRKLLRGRGPSASASPPQPPAAPPPAPSIPPLLQPVFDRLTTEEKDIAARMANRLDLTTLSEIGAALLPLPLDAQVAKVRQMIHAFEQREPSLAHRAVHAVLKGQAA
jgi:hypothetical protein